MSIFGWSLPPGCGALPGEEEQAIDLRDGKTLKGYGRTQHGLCGKDADLDYGGQVAINEAWWHEDGTIKVKAYAYASIVPEERYEFQADPKANDLTPEEDAAYEQYMALMTEVICGAGYAGEWDGDYWVLSLVLETQCQFDWDDAKTEEENTEAATARAYDLVMEHPEIKAFQDEMADCSGAMDKDKWDAGRAGATE